MTDHPAPIPDDPAATILGGMPDPTAVSCLEQMALGLPQVDLSTSMFAFGGMASRTIFIPAGTFLTGALTRIDNICAVFGDITVTTDDGPRRLTGFHVLPASAGAKRAGIAHADTWWTTIWRTDQTDAQAIEDEMTVESDQLQTRRPGVEFAKTIELEHAP